MPRGSKSSYSSKQKRMAAHIEESVRKRGGSEKAAERIGWATVNKETGGAKKKRSSTAKSTSKKAKASTKKSSSSSKKSSVSAKRSAAAKKGWATRRKSSE